jgi:hypothetical protein
VLEIDVLGKETKFSEEFAISRRYCNRKPSSENNALTGSSIHFVQLFQRPKVLIEESLQGAACRILLVQSKVHALLVGWQLRPSMNC